VIDDPRIEDRVADNRNKWEVTESETLLIGRNFGVGTDIQTGPNGNVFVVSLTNGAIYEIFRARQR
jgi:aldose sugar dehydrogenase